MTSAANLPARLGVAAARLNAPLATGILLMLVLFTEGTYLPLLYAFGAPRWAVQALLYVKYALALGLAILAVLAFVRGAIRLRGFEIAALLALVGIGGISTLHYALTATATPSRYVLYVFPLLLYLAGRALARERQTADRLFRAIAWLAVPFAAYAIVDVALLDETFWRDVAQQARFLREVKGEALDLFGVIGNFFFDPYDLRLRRAVGLHGDPLAFAYAMVLPLALMAGCVRARSRWAFVALMIVAIAFSLTRAIIISILIVLALRTVFRRRYVLYAWAIGLVAVFGAGSLSRFLRLLLLRLDSSTRGHFESLERALALDPIQFTLGVKIMGVAEPIAADVHFFESGLLNLASNYGVLNAVLIYAFVTALVLRLARSSAPEGRAVAFTGAVGIFTSIVFSESFFSFTGFGLFWLLAGISVRHYLHEPG